MLLLSINYVPEPTGFAPHAAYLSEYLAERGHTVKVITGFPFAPYWKRYKSYHGKFHLSECINEVEVQRLTHFIPRKPGKMIQRLLMEASFSLSAAIVALFNNRFKPDVVVYIGAQPSLAMAARFIAGWKGLPYLVFINDLATHAAVDVGIVSLIWIVAILEKFEYAAYSRAKGAVVLCSSFKKALEAHQYPSESIGIIHSPVDLEMVRPVDNGNEFREPLGISSDDFVVLFSGSMGLKQGLINVIEAARLLKEDDAAVIWLLVGDGELKATLAGKIKAHDLKDCVRLLPLQPKSDMSKMFAAADLLLLNQLSTVKDTVIPSKLLTYMASGRPVLAAVNASSQGARVLAKAGGGMWIPPENPAELAAAVRQIKADPNVLAAMGRSNRKYAEKKFDRRGIVAAQEKFLLDIVRKWHQSRVEI